MVVVSLSLYVCVCVFGIPQLVVDSGMDLSRICAGISCHLGLVLQMY